ncbi:MAG TPA: hypothetical protein VNA25_14120, partial [Phycisphaerae bacterium]|nr:hypothetical protein [Phycisphaerae bacterium]
SSRVMEKRLRTYLLTANLAIREGENRGPVSMPYTSFFEPVESADYTFCLILQRHIFLDWGWRGQ